MGAQRRPIDEDDLPRVREEIVVYLRGLRGGEEGGDSWQEKTAMAAESRAEYVVEKTEFGDGPVVLKERVAADGEYNLSGERYIQSLPSNSAYSMVELGDIAELIRGITFRKSDQLGRASEDALCVVTTKAAQESGIVEDALYHIPSSLLKDSDKLLQPGDILISTANSLRMLGRTTHVQELDYPISFGAFMSVIRRNSRVNDTFLLHCLRTEYARDFFLRNANTTTNISNLNHRTLAKFRIPLPPLNVQEEVVAEIEGYQKVIDGARAVVENYRPHIHVDPEWPMVKLEEVCQINPAKADPSELFPDSYFNYIDISCIENGTGRFLGANRIKSLDAPSRARRLVQSDDVLISTVRPNLKAIAMMSHVPDRSIASTGFAVLRTAGKSLLPKFLVNVMRSDSVVSQMVGMMGKGAYPSINQTDISSLEIPLPPLKVQDDIVAGIDAEQAIVDANRDLISRLDGKIQVMIKRMWIQKGDEHDQ